MADVLVGVVFIVSLVNYLITIRIIFLIVRHEHFYMWFMADILADVFCTAWFTTSRPEQNFSETFLGQVGFGRAREGFQKNRVLSKPCTCKDESILQY